MRSAFFLGVDAVAISNRSTAPVSPVALKASAGASESLPLISVNQPGTFLDSCRNNGWKIYAANAATGADPNQRSGNKTYVSASALGNPIQNHACILILGSEGEGLRWNIKKKADYDVCVEGPRMGQGRVDSLNVSVAAGLLCETFLRRPKRIGAPRDDLPDGSQARNHQEVTSGELLF